ncbi:MAG: 4-hydroxy-tetrahydrodipicolinate synthase [Fimbriimonadaceae bacterium]|nr:4-hydroxy-tetrahydrodipicolinate synthase [Fimbriimonadaceae bacterium]
MRADWGRLLTAMATPFGESGEVDLKAAKRLAAWLVDVQRNEGLVVSGTTGESPTLTPDEKLALLEAVKEEVGDRASVLFGAGTYDTAESCRLAREAEARGADGIMAVNPYYSRPGQGGLEAHFRAIADSTSRPVLLYNIQPRSAITLDTATLLRLAEVPNIAGVKEASGNLGQISEVIRDAPKDFLVYSGDDGLTLAVLALGGYGLVSVASHLVGREYREMIECFEADPARARAIHHKVEPLVRALFACPNPVPVKTLVADHLVEFSSRVRLPLVPLDQTEEARLRAAWATFQAS